MKVQINRVTGEWYYWELHGDGFQMESTGYFTSPQGAIAAFEQVKKKLGVAYDFETVVES